MKAPELKRRRRAGAAFAAKIVIPVVLAALLICSHKVAFPAAAEDPAAAKFQIGVILPLSGEGAALGEAAQNGIKMALEKLSPKERALFEINFEDDRFDPKATLAAYQKLRATRNIQAVVTYSSGTSKALAPIAEQEHVPLLAVASDPAIVKNRRWVVNFWVTPEEEAKVTLQEALKRGYKKIARITTVQEGFLSLKEKFDQVSKGALSIVLDEDYPLSEKDFKPYLSKLRSRGDFDAALLLLMPGHVGIFAKQARALGIKQPLFGIECFEEPAEVAISQGALLGQWYVNADEPNNAFTRDYLRKYPKASRWGAGNAHDLVLLLSKALEKNPTSTGVNEFLHQVKDFQGALGTFSASGDNRFTLAATVKVVTKDGFAKAY